MSKLTDLLKLHIWQIPQDNNEQFDYIQSIANNFEKIDEGMQDITEQQTTQNTNIEKNSNDIETNKTNIIELEKKHNKEIEGLESLIPFRTS